MKKLLIIPLFLFGFGAPLQAQIFVTKGDLKVGIMVTKNGRNLPIDSLCRTFDPITNMPIDLVVPEASSVKFIRDSLRTDDITLRLNFQSPQFINRPTNKRGELGMSTVAGSTNSYAFVDERKKDVLKFEWKVAYDQLQLLDLYPADYFTDYVAYTFQNTLEKYPDSLQYDWSQVDYIQKLDQQGLPIAPSFPYNHEGLLFVVHLTETAVVQMKGYHNTFHQIDTDNPFDLLLYNDLQPGNYEFVAKPYADAPERLWLKYPFSIKKQWWKTTQFQLLMGSTIPILFGFMLSLTMLNRQKRKEKEWQWKQQLTNAELKAIRAQLNPHFLFNALNSIQNLVSQQENERANLYITKLSRLLRQVLSSSERAFQELEDELQLTQLYLELEQLRFPFTLKVELDKSVNRNTLVPVMLLQPYVENAVKHAIAGHPDGKITINIHQDDTHIKFEILDNGPGLSNPNGHSKGLELGDNRIQHLNDMSKEQAAVSVNNRTDETGVIVKISLPIT